MVQVSIGEKKLSAEIERVWDLTDLLRNANGEGI